MSVESELSEKQLFSLIKFYGGVNKLLFCVFMIEQPPSHIPPLPAKN
jgi:hypothetical protein